MGQYEGANDPVTDTYTVDQIFTQYNQNQTYFWIIERKTGKKLWEGTSKKSAELWCQRHLIIPQHLLPKNKLAQAVADAFRPRR